MKNLSRGLLAATCATALAVPAVADAAPVTVNVRIEGASQTVYEGPVTTDARQLPDANSGEPRPCNVRDNGGNGGNGPEQGNATTAAYDAVMSTGQAFRGEYTGKSSFGGQDFDVNDFFVTQLGPDVAGGSPYRYHVLFVNGAGAQTGGCQIAAQSGQEIVWGYSADASRVLRLTGTSRVRPGEPFTVTVTDAKDGSAVEGAAVGGATSDARGQARVVVRDRGESALKAEGAKSIRSNALRVCATDGADGFCGTTTPGGERVQGAPERPIVTADLVSPFSSVVGLRDGQRFARGKGPRLLRGRVVDTGSIRTVKLRLTRADRGRCSSYSGRRERFVRRPCGAGKGFYFRIGNDPTFEYQLASRLPRGRYVLDINAIDNGFNRDDARRRGSNRVVFVVG
jgi:hypothetical protein